MNEGEGYVIGVTRGKCEEGGAGLYKKQMDKYPPMVILHIFTCITVITMSPPLNVSHSCVRLALLMTVSYIIECWP